MSQTPISPLRQRMIEDMTVRGDEIVLADDALPAADQVVEDVERLRRNGDHVGPATQLPLSVSSTRSSKR
jgi:hypothetical protein